MDSEIIVEGSYNWRTKGIPAMLRDGGTGSVLNQYNHSELHTVTGLSCVLRNSTMDFFKNGNLVIVRMNPQSLDLLPTSPAALWEFATSRPKHRKKQHNLSQGGFDFFIPSKLDDLEWQQKQTEINEFLYGDIDKPFILFVWDLAALPQQETALSIMFDLNFVIEYITDDQSAPTRKPVADPSGLMSVYLALVISLTRPTENPNHFQTAANVAKQIIRNPAFQQAFLSFTKMAGTAALTALV